MGLLISQSHSTSPVPEEQHANRFCSSEAEAELHALLSRFRNSLIYASLEQSITFFNFGGVFFLKIMYHSVLIEKNAARLSK